MEFCRSYPFVTFVVRTVVVSFQQRCRPNLAPEIKMCHLYIRCIVFLVFHVTFKRNPSQQLKLTCLCVSQSAYEIAKQVNKAAIDLFMELTENMVKNAAQMGQNFSITRKVNN